MVFGILQFHVTTRLKAHTTQRLLNSFTSLDSRDIARARPKKDAGLPPLSQKSISDIAQVNPISVNGHDSNNRQVGCSNYCCSSQSPPEDLIVVLISLKFYFEYEG